VQEQVRWERGGNEPRGEYIFLHEKPSKNHKLSTSFLNIKVSYQQLQGVEFVSDRVSYIILRGIHSMFLINLYDKI
jgi:hypothetical protein